MKLHLLVSASALALALVSPAVAVADDAVSAVAAGPTVYGRVTNTDGAPLAGAEIIVQGSGSRQVTDAQGRFVLPVTAGQTTFEVRYLGLPTVSQTVTATGGEAVSLAVILGNDATNLDEVVVTGVITDGIARSLNQQRNADGTINVLSSDAIGRYPDPNVAESLQRVPGIAIQRDQGEGRYINIRG
ncbi:MAG: TonB-dependent receptor, partial [Caulobacteraceae bacterium]